MSFEDSVLALYYGMQQSGIVDAHTSRSGAGGYVVSSAEALATVRHPGGLHLKVAARFVQIANQYHNTEIYVSRDGQRVNAKSCMGLVLLAAPHGAVLEVSARGPDAEVVVAALVYLLENPS